MNRTGQSANPESTTQNIAMDDQSDSTPRHSNLSNTDTLQIQREPQFDSLNMDHMGSQPLIPQVIDSDLRRSKRKRHSPDRLTYSTILESTKTKATKVLHEIFCLSTLFPTNTVNDIIHPILAYKSAVSDPDTMYLHQAYKQPDWPQFQRAMQEEMEGQMANGNY